MENTYVSKYVEELDDLIIDKVSDDDLIEEKVMYRLINGNLYMKVDDDQASNLASISSLVSEGKLVPENLDNVQETLDYLRHILSFTVNNAINDSGVENDGFEEFVKLTRNTVQDSINAMNKLHEGEPIEAEGTLVIDNLLKKLDLNNVEEVFANVFVIK
jgi:hypothetical protein